MAEQIYAIGDIHGQRTKLEEALALVEQDGGASARIVFLGDYTDRGPDSRGVIDLLIAGLADGRPWTCLLGNHDRMFAMFMEDYPRNDARLLVGYHWLHDRIGGTATLASYGVQVGQVDRIYQIHARAKAEVPKHHIAFLSGLKDYAEQEHLLFVHAGIRPGLALAAQSQDDLIWIRDEFLDDTRPHPWLVVHGHTPVPRPEHLSNRINLDTGAGYGKDLTVAVFEDQQVWTLTPAGRVPLLTE